jgi:hypothetical protein
MLKPKKKMKQVRLPAVIEAELAEQLELLRTHGPRKLAPEATLLQVAHAIEQADRRGVAIKKTIAALRRELTAARATPV